MLWLTGIVCLAIGIVAGLVIAHQANLASPGKLSELENKIENLQNNHAEYRDSVSDHFSTTAELVQQMTDSYRDVYQHLAQGAQALCTEDVASKLLPASEQPDLFPATEEDSDDSLEPPKDYAHREPGASSGALSEEFGLDKAEKQEA